MIEVRDGDRITVSIRGVNANTVVEFLTNITDVNGTRYTLEFELEDTDGDRSITSLNTKQGEITGDGVITSATARIIRGTVPSQPGEFWSETDLRRGNKVIANIAFGYQYGGHPVAYPNVNLPGPLDGPGRKVDNEGPSTLVNNVALTRTITVPANTRVRWAGGRIFNADNVARTVNIDVDNGTDTQDLFFPFSDSVGASGSFGYPSGLDDRRASFGFPLLLNAGDRIAILFAAGGASAGGTARSSAVWEEWIVI